MQEYQSNVSYICKEMETKSVLDYHQNRISKWLFAAVLLLCFFSFSGLTVRSAQTSSDAQQTSFLGRAKFRSVKSISYKSAYNQVKHFHSRFSPVSNLFHLAQLHTQVLSTRAGTYNVPLLNIQKISLFYRLKSVAQNDEENPALI